VHARQKRRSKERKEKRNDLVQRVQIINCSFPVHHETVFVHLNVGGTPSKYNNTKINQITK